jgi:hypothetical protein
MAYRGKYIFTDSFDISFFFNLPIKTFITLFFFLCNLIKMSNISNKQAAGTATKDRQQSMGNANNNQSVSSDMDIKTGTSLSSGQDADVLSNDDALHSEDNACNGDARITRELSEDALPHYYDDIIMSDNTEFNLQLDGNERPSLGKEH